MIQLKLKNYFLWVVVTFISIASYADVPRKTFLEKPTGPVILEVTGGIINTNFDRAAYWDLLMLDALPQHHISTTTPWYDGVRTFSGPLIKGLIKRLGTNSKEIQAIALNDYSISLPVSDFDNYDVILATRVNGQPLSIREKGPLFVIFPFDQHPELKNEVYYQRSIWQLNRLHFK